VLLPALKLHILSSVSWPNSFRILFYWLVPFERPRLIPHGKETVTGKQPSDFSYQRTSVDLSSGTISSEQIQCQDIDDCMGGIARGFRLLAECPTDEAYAPESTLLMTLGILSGTQFMTGLRTYFLAYSPLKRSLAGKPSAMWSAGSGKFGTKLRFLGIDEVVFTGRADQPTVLHISSHGEDEDAVTELTLEDGSFLVGERVNNKVQLLKERYGGDAHFAVIGPAGENYESVRYAAIALSTENQLKTGDPKPRFCGRGGMGGVMGSKNLLAIVANTKDGRAATAANFKDLNKEVARGAGSQRFRDEKTGGMGGTWSNYVALHSSHAMPEMNFVPTGDDRSSALYRINVESREEFVVKDEACYRCGIRCHKNVYDADADGKPTRFRAKLDFEPLNLLASNIGIFDPDQACTLVELVDEMGMDSISCGVTLSYAMRYNELHRDDGLAMEEGPFFGDFESVKKAVEQLGAGGRADLGQGTLRLSEATGETGYAMHCKGVEFPAYLPQTNPGYPWALAGGHMSMRTYLLLLNERETGMDYWFDAITNPARGMSILRDDILGTCKFTGLSNAQMADAVSELSGLEVDADEMEQLVLRTFLAGYQLEKQQGFEIDDYSMPLDIHEEFPQIELPYFNSREFFEELRGRVLDRFDGMLAGTEVGSA
jgi:aldehyde:ferredoxin oxidoreductase